MKNALVVFNYNAGRKKAVLYKKTLHKFLLKRCKKFKFISVEDLDSVDLSEFDTVFAAGGDGTVNNTAKYLINTDKTLAIIPAGTANLLASELGLSENINKTLKIIDKNNIKRIDTLDINGAKCVLRAGFGYDADIICKTPQSFKNKFGYFAYFMAGVIFALRLTPKNYIINFDNKELNVDATCIILANSANMYRNIFSVGKFSKPDDGFLDLFILKAKNPVVFFCEFLRILIGIKTNNKRAQYFEAKSVTIKNHFVFCHIDGEKMKLKDNITVANIPNSLNVYCNS